MQVCEGLPAGDYAIKQATTDDVEVSRSACALLSEHVVIVLEDLSHRVDRPAVICTTSIQDFETSFYYHHVGGFKPHIPSSIAF